MPTSGPNLGLTVSDTPGASNWDQWMNPNLSKLDALVQGAVKRRDLTAPPTAGDGDRYIIPGSATGAWAGRTNQIAIWTAAASAWTFYVPQPGWMMWDLSSSPLALYVWDGSTWLRALQIGQTGPGGSGHPKPTMSVGIDGTNTINNDLIALWLFYEGSGDVAHELVAGRDATASDAGTWVTNADGPLLVLDGTDDLTVPSDTIFDPSGDFTLLFDGVINNTAGGSHAILSHDDGGGGNNKWIWWLDSGATSFHINTPSSGSTLLHGNSWSPTAGSRVQLALTRSGSTFTFYRNGNPDGTGTSGQALPAATADFTIGQAEGSFFLTGQLGVIRLYSRALSGTEIGQLNNNPYLGVTGS